MITKILKQVKQYRHAKLRHRRMKAFYSMLLSSGDSVIDIGANRGLYTKMFLNIGAKVLSVEPHPDCLVALHQIKSPSLTILPLAVSDKIGVQSFMLCNEDEVSTLSTEFKEEFNKQDFLNWDQEISVETTTLDAIIKQHGLPDYLKLDIEGYEHLVLSRLSLAVNLISFEYTYPFRNHAETCIKHIDQIGNYVYNYYQFESFEFELDSWVSSETMIQILQQMDSTFLVGDIYARRQS